MDVDDQPDREIVITPRKVLDRAEPATSDAEAADVSAEPALAIIDGALLSFAGRALVSGDEVVDRLLDLRSAFVMATTLRELEDRDFAR